MEEEADAILWSSWASRYQTDLAIFVDEALDYLLEGSPHLVDQKFQVLNMCKSLDEDILLGRVLRRWPETADTRLHYRPHNWARQKLWLEMMLPHWLADSPNPYIYLVNNARQLEENWHWFRYRQSRAQEEIILDVTGAIYTRSDFVQQTWPNS